MKLIEQLHDISKRENRVLTFTDEQLACVLIHIRLVHWIFFLILIKKTKKTEADLRGGGASIFLYGAI